MSLMLKHRRGEAGSEPRRPGVDTLFQCRTPRGPRPARGQSAFTLIELLVVVAIIAVLISILLPSLSAARAQARAVKCGGNLRSVGQAVQTYLAEGRGSAFPSSYIYLNADGTYDLMHQDANHPGGYMHWSYFLFNKGQVADKAFQCPEFNKGGAPRTNPGPNDANWLSGQVDQNGHSSGQPGNVEDKQATFMSLTANAAIIPRNKFTTELSGGVRVNRFVNESEIRYPGKTILLAEFNKRWRAEGISEGAGVLSKSHRPVNPFYHVSTGSDEYAAPPSGTGGFVYGVYTDPRTFGLVPSAQLDGTDTIGVIDGATSYELNVIGRHHPGSDKLGGTTNFVYCDGHVERKFILKTLQNREWGEKYYSLSGPNNVEYLNDR